MINYELITLKILHTTDFFRFARKKRLDSDFCDELEHHMINALKSIFKIGVAFGFILGVFSLFITLVII